MGVGKAAHKWGGLGEVLEGNQLIDSQLDVRYRCECPAQLCLSQWLICTHPGTNQHMTDALQHDQLESSLRRHITSTAHDCGACSSAWALVAHDLWHAQAILKLRLRGAADVPKKTICTLPLGQTEVTAFANAVRKHYWCARCCCASHASGLHLGHLGKSYCIM